MKVKSLSKAKFIYLRAPKHTWDGNMSDNISLLLEISGRINEKVISLTRCLILTLLAYFVDGLQFRELKAALKISDGKLMSNLSQLVAMGYVEKSVIKLEKRDLTLYFLTAHGKSQYDEVAKLTGLIKEMWNARSEE
jgi:DNA-binding MarR family transcriptional regulator